MRLDEVKLLPCDDAELIECLEWLLGTAAGVVKMGDPNYERAGALYERLTRPTIVTDEVVERVARAIAMERATIERDIPDHQRGMVEADPRALARAAIAAMPTIPPVDAPKSPAKSPDC